METNRKVRLKLEDKGSGELFAACPVDAYPGPAVEAVTDSSRYFVIKIVDDGGRSAFIGMGFADRADSFDMNVTLQDHFQGVRKEEKISQVRRGLSENVKTELSFSGSSGARTTAGPGIQRRSNDKSEHQHS